MDMSKRKDNYLTSTEQWGLGYVERAAKDWMDGGKFCGKNQRGEEVFW